MDSESESESERESNPNDTIDTDDGDHEADTNTVSVVNIVGVGELGTEIDLSRVARDIDVVDVRYDPSVHQGLYLRFESVEGLVTLYRTGSYHIVGVDSVADLNHIHERFLSALDALEIDYGPKAEDCEVRNVVCTANYTRSLNLNAVAIGLGLERIEYEPEQFPGLVYRPAGSEGVFLLFTSGKIVITGLPSTEAAETAYRSLVKTLNELLDED